MSAAETDGPSHRRRSRRGCHAARPRIGLYSAAAVVAVAALGSSLVPSSSSIRPDSGPVSRAEMALESDAQRAEAARSAVSRGDERGREQPNRQPSAPPPKTSAPKASPTVHQPVGGLTRAEMDNAVAIIEAGQQLRLPQRALVVAIATALQESHLRNLANANVPESLRRPNEGVGSDHDSVGLFQQRPSWGTVAQLMDPRESARRFYAALVKVSGWERMAVTVAAQTVQVSAFPDAYAKWQPLAEQIVAAVV
ncbi:hypothetical protein Drose_23205 [Dactylosporangium roseum]|uniref:Peptidase M23B n=1 Tax=Dactylosporangium roseum TaxID=47989 RepID=A0ABY5Z0Y7_9ACTN|nr:hypothetical protein [Dactylosporangium roseum]UWZ34154.1 hypothetical protein Drose_23205 [Dactylosporangium roseum]